MDKGIDMKPTRRGFLKGLGAIAAGAVVNESIAIEPVVDGPVIRKQLQEGISVLMDKEFMTPAQTVARQMRITKEIQSAAIFNKGFGEGYKNLHWEEIN